MYQNEITEFVLKHVVVGLLNSLVKKFLDLNHRDKKESQTPSRYSKECSDFCFHVQGLLCAATTLTFRDGAVSIEAYMKFCEVKDQIERLPEPLEQPLKEIWLLARKGRILNNQLGNDPHYGLPYVPPGEKRSQLVEEEMDIIKQIATLEPKKLFKPYVKIH